MANDGSQGFNGFAPNQGARGAVVTSPQPTERRENNVFESSPFFKNFKFGNRARRRRDGWRVPQNSPTYSFATTKTTVGVGNVIPVVYGRNRVAGQVVQAYTSGSAVTGEETLFLLLCLGWGEFLTIGNVNGDVNDINSIDTLKINQRDSSEFQGLSLSLRMGSNDSATLPRTALSVLVGSVDQELEFNIAENYVTTNQAKFLEFKIRCPNGMFGINRNGAFAFGVTISYEIVGNTSTNTIEQGSFTVGAENASSFDYNFRSGELPGDETYTVTLTRLEANNINLPAGYQTQTNWVSVNEISGDEFSYPNLALLELSGVATDQFNGELPNISVEVEGRIIKVSNDGITLVNQYSNNPAWVALDILLNKNFGLGRVFSESDINISSFKDWADYCDQNGFEFNGVFDSAGQDAWEAFLTVCDAGQAVPDFLGSFIEISIDRERVLTSQFIGMDSIVEGSFDLSYRSNVETPDAVNLTYFDRDNDFRRNTVEIRASEPVAGQAYKIASISKPGVTSREQAIKEATLALNRGANSKRFITFLATLTAVRFKIGDVILVSHDAPGWGTSGKITTAIPSSGTEIRIDTDITLTGGEDIYVFDPETSVYYQRTYSGGPAAISAGDPIAVTPAWTIPVPAGASYCIGTPRPFIVEKISLNNDLQVEIDAREYNAASYDLTNIVVDSPVYTDLPLKGLAPDDITNLSVRERRRERETTIYTMDLYWTYQDPTNNGRPRPFQVETYYREIQSRIWQQFDVVKFPGTRATLYEQLIPGNTYEFCAVPVSFNGDKSTPDRVPRIQRVFIGETGRPDEPENFFLAEKAQLSADWRPVLNEDTIEHYEIRRGKSWQLAEVVAQVAPTNPIFYTVNLLTPIVKTLNEQYMLRAKDLNGEYATRMSVDVVDNTITPYTPFLQVDVKGGGYASGVLTNVTVNGDGELELSVGFNTGTYVEKITYNPGVAQVGNIAALLEFELDNNDTRTWADVTDNWESEFGQGETWEDGLEETLNSMQVRIRRQLLASGLWEAWVVGRQFPADFDLNLYQAYEIELTYTRGSANYQIRNTRFLYIGATP